MNKLYVYSCARSLGIENPVACIIRNITVTSNSEPLDDEINKLMNTLQLDFKNTRSSEEFIGFLELFSKMGYKDQIPAGQRLVESFLKNGFKRINNVVDAYNIISAKYACGIGMHDADKALHSSGNFVIFRSTGTESITPIFKNKSITTKDGDLVYGDKSNTPKLFAWLGKRDVDSNDYKVSEETRSLLLVVTGNSKTKEKFNIEICNEIFKLINKTCQNSSIQFLSTIKQCN